MAKIHIEIVNGPSRKDLLLCELEPWIDDYRRNEKFQRLVRITTSENCQFDVRITRQTHRSEGTCVEIAGLFYEMRPAMRNQKGEIIHLASPSFTADYYTDTRKGYIVVEVE